MSSVTEKCVKKWTRLGTFETDRHISLLLIFERGIFQIIHPLPVPTLFIPNTEGSNGCFSVRWISFFQERPNKTHFIPLCFEGEKKNRKKHLRVINVLQVLLFLFRKRPDQSRQVQITQLIEIPHFRAVFSPPSFPLLYSHNEDYMCSPQMTSDHQSNVCLFFSLYFPAKCSWDNLIKP